MTLLEIANYVCNLVGKTDSTSVTRCKEYVRQHHQLIYDSALWRELGSGQGDDAAGR